MTSPTPVRATEAVRVTSPDGSVVETVRTVEYAAQAPPDSPARAALPCGEHPYRPECCSPAAEPGMRLVASGDARRALPPGDPAPARRRWWPW